MRVLRLFLLLIIIAVTTISCSKDFDVNAKWKEIPVVYGLLNQNDSVHFIKITKAFLGEGNALMFAEIPDSSNYPVGDIEVKVEGWNGSVLAQTIIFHDSLIQNKDTGIFYYPSQQVYTSRALLNKDYIYKLFIRNLKTGLEVTSQTPLIKDFSISNPSGSPATANFLPNKFTAVEWTPAEGGKRYQLTAKFHYLEIINGVQENKMAEWKILTETKDWSLGAIPIKRSIPGESFYAFLHSKIVADPNITRSPREIEFIFTVASPELNTYMEITEPSNSIIQERPSFTNITNGIGLFSARYDNTRFNRIIIQLSDNTKAELKVNALTRDLNF